jgi:hypothetical protein
VNSQRKPVRRAFTGLVGLPPEPVVPTPVAAPEPVASITSQKSKAAIRAERWREKQKKKNPNYQEQERARKERERADEDREAEIAMLLKEKQPLLTAINEDGKQVRVQTGGYGSVKIAEQSDLEQQKTETDGRRVTRQGAAPANFDADAEKYKRIKEYDDGFVREAFKRIRTPREVKAMKNFIYSNVERYNHKSTLTVCSHCKIEITPFPQDVPLLAFHHFHDAHPNLFETMMAKVKKASEKPVCPEDHEGFVRRYGGKEKLQCHRCRKILWRPGDPLERSDKPIEQNDATSAYSST